LLPPDDHAMINALCRPRNALFELSATLPFLAGFAALLFDRPWWYGAAASAALSIGAHVAAGPRRMDTVDMLTFGFVAIGALTLLGCIAGWLTRQTLLWLQSRL
jgi:hypothetical protein